MSDLLGRYESDMGTICQNGKCTRQATHILTCHQIDYCTGEPDSCKAYFFCPECTQSVGDKISEHVNDDIEIEGNRNCSLICRRCDKLITKVSDVLTVEYLYDMSNV